MSKIKEMWNELSTKYGWKFYVAAAIVGLFALSLSVAIIGKLAC